MGLLDSLFKKLIPILLLHMSPGILLQVALLGVISGSRIGLITIIETNSTLMAGIPNTATTGNSAVME